MNGTNWVYIKSESGLWTVGFYAPNGEWHPETDCNSIEYAAQRCNYLNGGKNSVRDQLVKLLKEHLAESKDTLEAVGGCDHSVGICSCELAGKIEGAEKFLKSIGEEI